MARRLRSRHALWLAAMALPAAVSARAEVSRDSPLEYAVKMAYLPKFANYVDWPTSAFATPQSDLTLCITGAEPFSGTADSAIEGQHVGERRIVVRHLDNVYRESGCQILFVAGVDPKRVGKVVDSVLGTGVLTVSEVEPAGQTPSIIRFVIADNHVRFAIDVQAAAQNGISVSSKLLSLALTVTPQR